MRIQLIGLGHVGQSLNRAHRREGGYAEVMWTRLHIVSVSDSKGTAVDNRGLCPPEILRYKTLGWKGFGKYVKGRSALDAIGNIESDVTVELTPSTPTGEPGLSNIRAALAVKKSVVTANKGPLVVAYGELVRMAEEVVSDFCTRQRLARTFRCSVW